MRYILILFASLAMMVKAQNADGVAYDKLDAEAIVADKDRFQSFVGCFTDTAPCTEVTAAAIKKEFPEVIVQACSKCTSAQKHIANVFVTGFKKHLPQEYEDIKDTYDPEKKYFPKFEAAVAEF